MTTLVSGTQPVSGGTASLTDAVTVGPSRSVATANSLSTSGIFTYSAIRPVLLPTVTVPVPVTVATANSLSTTGIFTYSAIRPVLADTVSISLTQRGAGQAGTSAPATRQILIR